MLRPSTNPEEQRFLRGLEQRDNPLFIDIMKIIDSTREKLSKVTNVEESRIVLQEATDAKKALFLRYKDSTSERLESDFIRAASIVIRMVLQVIDRIKGIK